MPFDLAVIKRHKVAFVIGGIVAGGIAWYGYEKSKSSGSANGPASSYGYGYGYGLGASGALYGYGYGAYNPYGYGGFGYGGFGYGGFPGVGVPTPPTGTPPTPAASNAIWAQQAEAFLVAQGYNPLTVSAALGKYLTAQTVTADQASIVQAAIAFENYPPVAGAGGFPPSIHTSTSTGQGGGKKVKVPHATGLPYIASAAKVKAVGLQPRRGEPNVGTVKVQTPRAGTMAEKGSVVVLSNGGNGPSRGEQMFPGGPDKKVK